MCFQSAELYFNNDLSVVGNACYLEGLRIILEESTAIPPLEYLQLCIAEQHILIAYIVPGASP